MTGAEEIAVAPTPEQLFTISIRAKPLFDGKTLMCPKCGHRADVLDYTPLQYVERYAEHLVPPLKCRKCRHVFALRP